MTIADSLRRRIDGQLAARVGVSVADLHRPGVHLAPGTWTWDDVVVLVLPETVWVEGPVELVTSIGNQATHLSYAEASDPGTWRALLPGATVTGPSLHAYTATPTGVDTSTVHEVSARDLADLEAAMPADAWAEGGFAGDDVSVRLGLADESSGTIVAASNLTPWDEADADVGVAVHPDLRGRGWGRIVGAAATDRALQVHGAARWRALASNQPSLAIARSLGFQPYGSNLLVRPEHPVTAPTAQE